MTEPYNSETIEKYLQQEMDTHEREKFVAQIRANPALEAEVAAQQMVMETYKNKGLIEFSNRLERIQGKQNEVAKSIPMRKRYRYWLVAASILVLILLGSSWYVQQNYSNEMLAQTFYEKDLPMASRARDISSNNPQLEKVKTAFTEADYTTVILAKTDFLPRDPYYLEYHFWLGCAYFQTQQNDLAITTFKEVVNSTNIRKERAEWMLALTYLQADQSTVAKQYLTPIANDPQHDFKSEAANLLNQLGSSLRLFVF